MSKFASFAAFPLPLFAARPWLASHNALPFRRIDVQTVGRGGLAVSNKTAQAAPSTDRHAKYARVSPAKLLKGVIEIEVDSAPPSLSIVVLNQLADRTGVPARETCWIAPTDAAASAVPACPGLSVYTPRTTRESIWAMEQALVAANVRAVAAWLPHFRSARRQSELRLLRRLRALALRQGKTVVLLRYVPAARASAATAANEFTAAA